MAWEKVAVPFRITVSDEETVLPYVRQQLRGIQQYSWVPPNEAAQYCLTKKIDLPEALKWVELSIQNEERFENLATKTDILKAMGKTAEADKPGNTPSRSPSPPNSTPMPVNSRERNARPKR